MPYTKVMGKFKSGKLHSGSKHGPVVKNKKQAVAIMLSEKEDADADEQPQRLAKPKRRKS